MPLRPRLRRRRNNPISLSYGVSRIPTAHTRHGILFSPSSPFGKTAFFRLFSRKNLNFRGKDVKYINRGVPPEIRLAGRRGNAGRIRTPEAAGFYPPFFPAVSLFLNSDKGSLATSGSSFRKDTARDFSSIGGIRAIQKSGKIREKAEKNLKKTGNGCIVNDSDVVYPEYDVRKALESGSSGAPFSLRLFTTN